MPMTTTFTAGDVSHIARLANIPLSPEEEKKLAEGFTTTIAVVEQLLEVNVKGVEAANASGLTNVLREDVVDEGRMFTQNEALANAPAKGGGYFVVDQLIQQED